MAEGWDAYMKQRLVDVALGRRGRRPAADQASASAKQLRVQQLDEDGFVFTAQSEKDEGQVYQVDIQLGWCSCVKGRTGRCANTRSPAPRPP